MRLFSLICIVLIGCSKGDCYQSGSGAPSTAPQKITGVVVEGSTELPISNCTVKYEGIQGSQCENWQEFDYDITDSEGRFELNNVYEEANSNRLSFYINDNAEYSLSFSEVESIDTIRFVPE